MRINTVARLAVAFILGGSSLAMAATGVPATNTAGTITNGKGAGGTQPNALVWGNGAVLDMTNAGNNMNKSLIMGVNATVSGANVNTIQYNTGSPVAPTWENLVDYHRKYSYQPTSYLPKTTDRTDAASVIALGTQAAVYASPGGAFIGGISIGDQSTTYGSGTAVGGGTFAATHATALGYEAMAEGDNSVALGYSAYASKMGSVALGQSAYSTGADSIALGMNSVADSADSTALGFVARANAQGALAVGTRSVVTGVQSGAFGYNESYLKPAVSGNYSYSVGAYSQVTSDWSSNLGSYNMVGGYASHSVGTSNNVSGEYSVALGDFNNIKTKHTYALGDSITNTIDDSVFLGSYASYVAEGATTAGISKAYTGATINGMTYKYAGGDITTGVVSVGSTKDTRRVQNMAPGLISATSTDAINGSQLYATNSVLGNLANTTASGIGGGTTVNPDGTLNVALTVAGSTYNNVQDALNAIPISTGGGSTTAINPNGIYYDDGSKNKVTLAGPNGTTITNVADGLVAPNSKDAVNGGQLFNVSNKLTAMGDRINKVGAGAAALASLHPLDFDPDDKWNFAAGYGHYAGANAAAIGAFYRPNEDTMFNVSGTIGNGDSMIGVGVSLKLGQKNGVSTSKVAMAKEIEDLKGQVQQLTSLVKEMAYGNTSAVASNRNMIFPDVPKDHWAYGYVKGLADRGFLTGYPDGTFKGDRAMTRYEFAALVYRAHVNGAPIDSNLDKFQKEFGPELERVASEDRFRVDRISGKDNDRNKIERVRINNKDNKENNDFRDVYGSHIGV